MYNHSGFLTPSTNKNWLCQWIPYRWNITTSFISMGVMLVVMIQTRKYRKGRRWSCRRHRRRRRKRSWNWGRRWRSRRWEEEDEDLKAQKELELEAAGVKFSEINEENKKSHSKIERELPTKLMKKGLKKIMMSNKQKKLFKKMQYGIEKKKMRKTIDQKKKQLNKRKNNWKNWIDRKCE